MDATGIRALDQMATDFMQHGATVLLSELRPNVRQKLERGGVIERIGEDHVFETLARAMLRANEPTPAIVI
jgi:anti-anti-sigma regulatory factor